MGIAYLNYQITLFRALQIQESKKLQFRKRPSGSVSRDRRIRKLELCTKLACSHRNLSNRLAQQNRPMGDALYPFALAVQLTARTTPQYTKSFASTWELTKNGRNSHELLLRARE
jgi:hypothetical protein